MLQGGRYDGWIVDVEPEQRAIGVVPPTMVDVGRPCRLVANDTDPSPTAPAPPVHVYELTVEYRGRRVYEFRGVQ